MRYNNFLWRYIMIFDDTLTIDRTFHVLMRSLAKHVTCLELTTISLKILKRKFVLQFMLTHFCMKSIKLNDVRKTVFFHPHFKKILISLQREMFKSSILWTDMFEKPVNMVMNEKSNSIFHKYLLSLVTTYCNLHLFYLSHLQSTFYAVKCAILLNNWHWSCTIGNIVVYITLWHLWYITQCLFNIVS
jgi:hypothetical protein